jgi:magnesium transporter
LTDPEADDLKALRERLPLHGVPQEALMNGMSVPKVDFFEDQVSVVLPIAELDEDIIKYTDVDVYIGLGHIVMVFRSGSTELATARKKLKEGPRSTRLGPDFVLHAIIDEVVSSYLPVVQMIEDEVLAMEQRILDSFLDREDITRLFQLRREAIQFQHVLARLSEICGKLINVDAPCISAAVKPYIRDVNHRLGLLDTLIASLVAVIRAAFETSSLLEQQRQGIITRRLAAWAAILAVPTAIAGIYGMNFDHMPELHTVYGYPAAVSVILLACAILFARFKRLRWI